MSQTSFTPHPAKTRRNLDTRPPSVAVSTAKLRLWTFLLCAAAALLIVACVACFVFLRNQVTIARPPSQPADTTPVVAPPLPVLDAAPPPVVVKATPQPPVLPQPIVTTTTPSPPVAIKPAAPIVPAPVVVVDAKAAMQRDRVLEAVGSLSAVQLYQCYLNVGLLADAVEHETYSKKEAGDILDTITLLLESARTQMEKLEAIELEADEVQALKNAEGIAKLLKAQAGHLREHWASGEKAAIERYHEVRKQSWSELAKILGVDG